VGRAKVGSLDGEEPRVGTLYGEKPSVGSLYGGYPEVGSLDRHYSVAVVLFAALLRSAVSHMYVVLH
jgi:hypothetical protein